MNKISIIAIIVFLFLGISIIFLFTKKNAISNVPAVSPIPINNLINKINANKPTNNSNTALPPGVVLQPGEKPPTPVPVPPPDKFVDNCLAQKGVVQMDFVKEFQLECKEFDTGKQLQIASALPVGQEYLRNVYPYASITFPATFKNTLYFTYGDTNKLSNKTVVYAKNTGTLYEQPGDAARFYNTQYAEVALVKSEYKNLVADLWMGCWYDMVVGTGFFIPTRATMMAYNSVHCLVSIGISPEKILQYSSAAFKEAIIAAGKTIDQVIKEASDYKTYKYNYLKDDSAKRYVASMVAQRGYKTLQLSNEYDGTFRRSYFVDLVDPVLSTRKIVRVDPFKQTVNPVKAHWYLNLFNKSQVPDSLIVMNDTNRRYDEFPFKEQCRVAGGTISITEVYLECIKILKFGAPVEVLLKENRGSFSSMPKSNQLEKLQSYFTVVYGAPEIWKTKTEAELQKRFDYLEIYYTTLLMDLSLVMTRKGERTANFYDVNTGWGPEYNTTSLNFGQFLKRPAEQLDYVEVFRRNQRSSVVEDPPNFASFYYFPCRGSGYFLPTGKLFIGKYKNTALNAVGQPQYKEPDWTQDKILARTMMYKDIDCVQVVYFDYRCELIHIRDPITSQMSLIRTHPFDPKVNKINENLVTGDYYHSIATSGALAVPENCIIKKQFDGSVDNVCVNTGLNTIGP